MRHLGNNYLKSKKKIIFLTFFALFLEKTHNINRKDYTSKKRARLDPVRKQQFSPKYRRFSYPILPE